MTRAEAIERAVTAMHFGESTTNRKHLGELHDAALIAGLR